MPFVSFSELSVLSLCFVEECVEAVVLYRIGRIILWALLAYS